SEGLEGRNERPATGRGWPEAALGALRHDRLKPVLLMSQACRTGLPIPAPKYHWPLPNEAACK
ncbi:MAG: hypothetical protein WCJ18_01020, partial [Planctomycetota bacterium]